jgi:hypothetical protein
MINEEVLEFSVFKATKIIVKPIVTLPGRLFEADLSTGV